MPTTDAPKPEEKNEPAPWGDDFDAARAWTLVQNLRTENAALKTENGTLKSERQEREDGEKTELQKLQEALATAEKNAADATRTASVARVLRKFPDLADFEDLLVGDTEEEIAAKAERLAAIGKPKDDAKDGGGDENKDEDEGKPVLPGRPAPALTPGHGGDNSPAPFDPEAIAKAALATKY